MKTLLYIVPLLCLLLLSCKKQLPGAAGDAGMVATEPIYFQILDKNGNNIIHSVNDSLVVTYTMNGVSQSSLLDVFKIQTSATDTTTAKLYNGYLVSDYVRAPVIDGNPENNNGAGYMTWPSWGAVSNPNTYIGVTDFKFYLNGSYVGPFILIIGVLLNISYLQLILVLS